MSSHQQQERAAWGRPTPAGPELFSTLGPVLADPRVSEHVADLVNLVRPGSLEADHGSAVVPLRGSSLVVDVTLSESPDRFQVEGATRARVSLFTMGSTG